jgi:hypothetical protein
MRHLATMLVVLCAFSTARAYEQPANANKAQFALVNGYDPCSSPNTNLLANGAGACAPPVASGACGFGNDGSGKMVFKKIGSAAQGTEDLLMTAVAQGLNDSCEGLSLWFQLSFRLSTNDCPLGSCTELDILDQHFASAPCVVRAGKCKIRTTINTAIPGYTFIANGKNSGIQILACGLHSSASSLFNAADLACGVLLR